jgi:hypothetical protein
LRKRLRQLRHIVDTVKIRNKWNQSNHLDLNVFQLCWCFQHHYYIKSYNFKIATARGGNVIGGGDWNDNRLVPDIMRSIFLKKKLIIRNRNQVRPFQHILDVNFSYLKLLKLIISNNKYCSSYNIGPKNSYRVSEVLNFYKKYIKNNLVFKKEKLKEKSSIFLDTRKSVVNYILPLLPKTLPSGVNLCKWHWLIRKCVILLLRRQHKCKTSTNCLKIISNIKMFISHCVP